MAPPPARPLKPTRLRRPRDWVSTCPRKAAEADAAPSGSLAGRATRSRSRPHQRCGPYNPPVRRRRSASRRSSPLRVGIDTGGTFTDFHVTGHGVDLIFKVPSTPHDPSAAVLEGLRLLRGGLAARGGGAV